MKLLVTGCARSGTTMMIHLMQYFYSCQVITEDEIHPYNFFEYNDSNHVLVIKKPYLNGVNVQKFSLPLLFKLGWKVIWMLRDGRDVISSQVDGQYWCEPYRWTDANTAMLSALEHKNMLIVRYEDLCCNMAPQMDTISRFIGQSYADNYNNWWTKINADAPMDKGMRAEPTKANTGAYVNHEERVSMAMQNQEFRNLLNIFGYGTD